MILADEPTASLDEDASRVIEDMVIATSRAPGPGRRGWVWVSHDRRQARRLADHLVVIDQGRVLATGAPAALRDHCEPLVRALAGGES